MNKTKSFLTVASLLLALTFTFSCSSDGGGGGGTTGTCGGKRYNTTYYDCVEGEIVGSCKGVEYSPESHHCDANGEIQEGAEDAFKDDGKDGGKDDGGDDGHFNPSITYGSINDSRDKKNYRTVEIGTQTWMAENLNYEAEGSKCVGVSGASGTLLDNGGRCETYGRLYDWATAMGLPSDCNSKFCASQIQTPHHKGICPSGWHIPSRDELSELFRAVGGRDIAGSKLKSKTGWGPCDFGLIYEEPFIISCEDEHGFSALPGGHGNSDGSFSYVGESGWWWSAHEDVLGAYRLMVEDAMKYVSDFYVSGKTYLHSVRCVQDN